jgi:hypothetical protein
MRSRTQDSTRRGGALLAAVALVLLGLATLLTTPASAQTSGGATADNGSVASGTADARNGSTASGDAVAENGSVASGCSTARNNSTASGGECLTAPTTPPTTAGPTPTTAPPDGAITVTTRGVTATTAAGRLAVTGSQGNRLTQAAMGLLFFGLILVALGLDGPARETQA